MRRKQSHKFRDRDLQRYESLGRQPNEVKKIHTMVMTPHPKIFALTSDIDSDRVHFYFQAGFHGVCKLIIIYTVANLLFVFCAQTRTSTKKQWSKCSKCQAWLSAASYPKLVQKTTAVRATTGTVFIAAGRKTHITMVTTKSKIQTNDEPLYRTKPYLN